MRRRTMAAAFALGMSLSGLAMHRFDAADGQMRAPPFVCNGVRQASPNCGPPVPRLQGYRRIDKAFGALAYDGPKGAWFGSYQYPSKREAQAGVMTTCRESGGTACTLMLSYTNQCAAVARAVVQGREQVGHDSVDTGSTQEEAVAHAQRSCANDWGTDSCKIQLVNCSHHNVVRWKEWVYD